MFLGALQVAACEPGSLETIAFPALSTATQSETDGHDTPVKYAGQGPAR